MDKDRWQGIIKNKVPSTHQSTMALFLIIHIARGLFI